jgi:hypothetical protein
MMILIQVEPRGMVDIIEVHGRTDSTKARRLVDPL